MSKFLLRLKKSQKKGISPAIATIILIVVALVIALLVGVFAFGLFSSNATSLTVQGGSLTAAGAFSFAVHNPNPTSDTTLVSVFVNGVTETSCTPVLVTGAIPHSMTTPVSCTGATLTSGDTYTYQISFGNGQSLSGAAVAI